jgi:hypothetical protein
MNSRGLGVSLLADSIGERSEGGLLVIKETNVYFDGCRSSGVNICALLIDMFRSLVVMSVALA